MAKDAFSHECNQFAIKNKGVRVIALQPAHDFSAVRVGSSHMPGQLFSRSGCSRCHVHAR
jgi:hypothetical protein